jgi:predicted nuclease with TOPRIM domain
VVLPVGDHDHMGCFTNQVKLTCALVRDLDEAVKEVKLLEEHREESSQKITKLEALCKKLRKDTQRLEEEKATLEEMVESHDELLMEIARETGLDRMGEDAEDEVEDEDADDRENAAAPPVVVPPTAVPEEVVEEEDPVEMVPEQEAHMAHEVILADVEPEMLQPQLYHAPMRDYEESPPRMMDDLDDLDDDTNEGHSDMDEWFPEDGSNDRD